MKYNLNDVVATITVRDLVDEAIRTDKLTLWTKGRCTVVELPYMGSPKPGIGKIILPFEEFEILAAMRRFEQSL